MDGRLWCFCQFHALRNLEDRLPIQAAVDTENQITFLIEPQQITRLVFLYAFIELAGKVIHRHVLVGVFCAVDPGDGTFGHMLIVEAKAKSCFGVCFLKPWQRTMLKPQ